MKCTNCGSELEAGSSFCSRCGTRQAAPSGATLVIGRDPRCDIVLSGEKVSRRHATLSQQGSEYLLTDQNSMNGTFVNGRRITSATVRPGDQILLGNAVPLDWNAALSAFQSGGGGGGQAPQYHQPQGQFQDAEPYNPVFVQEAPLYRKKQPVLLFVGLGVAVLGLAIGAYFLLRGSGGGNRGGEQVKVDHIYKIIPGEESETAAAHSHIQAREALLKEAKTYLNTEHTLLTLYCLLELVEPAEVEEDIPEQPNAQNSGSITRSYSTKIKQRDFQAREDYLLSKSSYIARIKDAEETLAKAKQRLDLTSNALRTLALGDDFINKWTKAWKSDTQDEETPPADQRDDDSAEPVENQKQAKFDLLTQTREEYKKALDEYIAVYATLDNIRTELIRVNAANKKGKMNKN